MDVAKQRIRAVAARKKEERQAKGTDEGNSSVPKSVSKVSKRKLDGDDDCPSKRTAVTLVTPPRRGSRPLNQVRCGQRSNDFLWSHH